MEWDLYIWNNDRNRDENWSTTDFYLISDWNSGTEQKCIKRW